MQITCKFTSGRKTWNHYLVIGHVCLCSYWDCGSRTWMFVLICPIYKCCFHLIYSPVSSNLWFQLWRKRSVYRVCMWVFLCILCVCVVFGHRRPSASGLVAFRKQPPLWTHTHTLHLLYILKHAVSLRSWKENAFFLWTAAIPLSHFWECACACLCELLNCNGYVYPTKLWFPNLEKCVDQFKFL